MTAAAQTGLVASAPADATNVTGVEASATGSATVYARATMLIASIAVMVVGFDLRVAYGASAALPVAILLLPFWLPVLREYSYATLITGLAALSAVSGLVLSELSAVDHQVSSTNGVQAIGLLASGIAALCLILWARAEMPLHRVAALYGAGALTSAIVDGQLSWKYNLAVPTAFLVLGVLERYTAGVLPAIAIFTIGVIAAFDEGRSYFGLCVLAATLTIWQLRPRSSRRNKREYRWFPAVLLAGVGVAIYLLTTALATGGALGETLQARSTAQIEASGSLIAGGRPEWAATRELVELNPVGYGVGVIPNWTDRMAGRAGLASMQIDIDEFRDRYMFGSTFELHSVAADLWARSGWVGVALAATIAFTLVRSLSFRLAGRTAPTYVIFGCALALWYVLFGPMYSNWLDVCVALGIALIAQSAPLAAPEPTATTSL